VLLRLIALGPDEGAGEAVRIGSDIFFAMTSMMRSALWLTKVQEKKFSKSSNDCAIHTPLPPFS
jgi:hypothetical protein